MQVNVPVARAVESGTWTRLPLDGGNFWCLAIDPVTPSVVYAGSGGGVFRSTDGGDHWQNVMTVLKDEYVLSLAVDPVTPTTVYAGTSDHGVFRSRDSGEHWQNVMTYAVGKYVMSLAVTPVTPSVVYAGSGGGVFRSTDGGDHWQQVTTGLTAKNAICSLAVNPVTPTTVYAGTFQGLLRSTDGGSRWQLVSSDLPTVIVEGVVIDPATPSTMYAGMQTKGIFRSTDAGDHWEQVANDLTTQYIFSLAIDSVTPSILYVGTFYAGIFRSTDKGDHWQNIMTGTTQQEVDSLVVDPKNPSTLYAGMGDGVFRWSAPSPPSIPAGLTTAGSVDTVTLMWRASTAGTSPLAGYAVYRSTRAGSSGDVPVATVGATETKWTDTTCQQGITYYYAVAAFDNQTPPLYSAKSSEVSETLLQQSPPSVPGGLAATSSVIDIRLGWSPSTAGSSLLGGYAVYRSTAAGSPGNTPVATVGTTVTRWTDTSCQQGTTYYYTVAAFGSEATPLYSGKSTEASAKLLVPPPVVLTLTLQLGNTRMQVSGSDGTSETVTLDAAPVLGAGNRTLVPVRAVAEAMGGTVGWDPVTRTASVTVGSNTLELTLGKNMALFNGTMRPIDTDPKVLPLIINGRTMLPLRFVVESLGAQVSYDQATKTITITDTKS